MPDIDLTDVILDTLPAGEALVVIERRETKNNFGESTLKTISTSAWGGITPVGDNSLIREDAFDASAKTINVITNYPLSAVTRRAGGIVYKPSLVLWNDDYYEVKVLHDYSHYGQGFVEAECMSIDYLDLPPTNIPPLVAQLNFSLPNNAGIRGDGC